MRSVVAVPLTLAAILGLTDCVQNDGTRWSPLEHFELMSLDDERQLGMDFDDQIEKKFRLITDPVVTGFLYDLGQQIVASIAPQPFIYRFRIVRDSSLNAFAVPGGYIYVHSGTLLSATSVDELASVIAHEVAHVNKRHYAHRVHDRQIPSLLTQAALIAASVVSQSSAPLITGLAINVAVDLKYSRSDEAEADRLGAVYASRAGFDPEQAVHFFQRILGLQALYPNHLPPYLFSHPDVKDRIRIIAQQASSLAPARQPAPGTRERFRRMQARLAQLIDLKQPALLSSNASSHPRARKIDLERIDQLIREKHPHAALTALTSLAVADPRDPRIPFRIADLLYQAGQLNGAIAAYRQTVELDPSRALVFYKLGIAYRDRGNRHQAVHALEQAALRATRNGALATQARWEVIKLTFGVIAEAGFSESPVSTGAEQVVWWARVSGPVLSHREEIRVRWRDPNGSIVQEAAGENTGRLYLVSRFSLPQNAEGVWSLEVLLDQSIVYHATLPVAGSTSR